MAQAKKPNSTAPAVSNLRKIVLDPGHGGKDPGAIGVGGLAEKDVVLSIAKKLARKLKTEMGIQVVLTRQDDRFVASRRPHRAWPTARMPICSSRCT